MYRGGLNYMRYSVSDTAEHGDYTGGPRIVTDETRAEMKKMLAEIQDGTFAQGVDRRERDGRAVVQRDARGRAASTRSSRSAKKPHPPPPQTKGKEGRDRNPTYVLIFDTTLRDGEQSPGRDA